MNMNRLNTIIGTMHLSNIIITKIVNTEKYYNTYLNINKNNIKIITDLENYCYAESIDKIDNSKYINQFNIKMLYEKTYCEKTILSNLDNIFNKTKVPKYIIPDTYHVYNTEFTKYYINYDQLNYNKGTSIINFDENKSVQKTLRKPIDQLKEFKAAGKVALRKFLDDINAVDTKMNGRINEEIMLLKVQ